MKNNLPTIADIAMSAEQKDTLGTLVTAVLAADKAIAEILQNKKAPHEITVFAPTNEAFAKLSTETLKSLLKDKEKLSEILKYHVVDGDFTADKIVKLHSLNTLEGSDLSVKVKDGNVFINGAKVTKADIKAQNGTIHIIDTVLIPS